MVSASFAFAPLRLRRELMDQPKQGAQQNAQQRPSVGLRPRFGYAAVSVISLYFAIINHLLTDTYNEQARTENPCVGGSNPLLTISKYFAGSRLWQSAFFVSPLEGPAYQNMPIFDADLCQ